MQLLFPYFVKLSCSLALVYLLYRLLLRRLTFYNAARWYLLCYSVLCFFIPIINITGLIERHKLNNSKVVRAIPALKNLTGVSEAETQNDNLVLFTGWNICVVVFAAGMALLLLRLLLQYLSYRSMRRRAQLVSDNGIKLYQVDTELMPFSFGNSIFLNQHMHSKTELQEIIRHEYVHVTQRHTIDIIWAEVLCLLNWYNPFAWALRHAIRQNLEFIADNRVVQSGIDKKEYQYLLLKVMGAAQFRIVAPFNFSSLKKRIVMMNKLKTAKAHLVEFLFILPLLLVLLLAFRTEQTHKKEQQNGNVVKPQSDTVPEPPTPPAPTVIVTPPEVAAVPDEYSTFLKRNPEVSGIHWNSRNVTIKLKSGKKETYRLDDAKSMATAEKKWGVLPVAPPPPPPPPPLIEAPLPADTADITGSADGTHKQQLIELRSQMDQLNDSIHNGNENQYEKAMHANLNAQNKVREQEQQALLEYLHKKPITSVAKHKAVKLELQQRQAALADYRKAAQEHVKNEASAKKQVEIQEQLRLYQKAQVNAQKEIEALTHKDLTKQAQHHKEHKAAQELLHKKQIELRQKGEPK